MHISAIALDTWCSLANSRLEFCQLYNIEHQIYGLFKIHASLYEIVTPSWYLDFSVVTSFTGGGNWPRTTTGVKATAAAINKSIILSTTQTRNYCMQKQKRCDAAREEPYM